MRLLTAFILLTISLLCQAQGLTLKITCDEELPKAVRSTYDKLSAGKALELKRSIRATLIGKGYLEASFDSCATTGKQMNCQLHLGKQYKWIAIRKGNLNPTIASQAGFREKLYRNEPISPTSLADLMQGILSYFEDNGYPFVSARLDSILFKEEGISAALNVEKNRLCRIDALIIKGESKTAQVLIEEQIDISPGDLYNETKVKRIEKRLKELPFIKVKQAPYVLFTPERTELYLFLEDKKASSISGILGVLPNEATGKINFTGDLDLDLRSALNRGERIKLEWRRLQDQTQDLDLGFSYPFLFNSPFGVDAGLTIYRRDTTFLEVTSKLGGSIALEDGDRISAFIRRNASSRLGQRNTVSSSLADTRSTFYGLELQRDRTDYRRNPRRGHLLNLNGAVGNKTSQAVTPFGEEAAPETRTVQYEVRGMVATHVPIGKRSTIRTAIQGGSMINDVLFRNEIFRIGGFKDMRGIDDVSITASSWSVATVEYRFLFEENSNFFLFMDQGWWEDPVDDYTRDTPIAFGVGTNFETSSGIFSLSYALGRQFDQAVRFNSAKVHFGFASVF